MIQRLALFCGPRIVGAGEQQLDGFVVKRLLLLWEHRNRVLVCGLGNWLNGVCPDLVVLHGTTNLMNIVPTRQNARVRSYQVIIDDHNLPSVADTSCPQKCIMNSLGGHTKTFGQFVV